MNFHDDPQGFNHATEKYPLNPERKNRAEITGLYYWRGISLQGQSFFPIRTMCSLLASHCRLFQLGIAMEDRETPGVRGLAITC